MKIGIANDRHGIEVKGKIKNYLDKENIEYIDYGCGEDEVVDYVDYAVKLCDGINKNECNLGILICGTGIGMCIVANKIKGIICGKVTTQEEATLTREHNHANVIAVGENIENIENIIEAFLNTEPSLEERHVRRVNKINNLI